MLKEKIMGLLDNLFLFPSEDKLTADNRALNVNVDKLEKDVSALQEEVNSLLESNKELTEQNSLMGNMLDELNPVFIIPSDAKMIDATSIDIEKIFEKVWVKHPTKGGFYGTADTSYYTYDLKTIQSIVNQYPLLGEWVAESKDCDDHNLRFQAMMKKNFPQIPWVYCWLRTSRGEHAANAIIYRTNTGRLDLTYIEPQTGKISYFASWKPYLMWC